MRQRSGHVWTPSDAVAYIRGPEPLYFDWKDPDYAAVWAHRAAALERVREDPGVIGPAKVYYATYPAEFISDWGTTYDPRNADVGLPTKIPFILFPKQEEWVAFTVRNWRARLRALTEKSRESGVSWLAISTACTLCLFVRGMAVGFGSNLARNVDTIGDEKSLLEKARIFMEELPAEWTGGWNRGNSRNMAIFFPESESKITGDGGDNIGRSDRTSLYFVDEAAHLERPQLTEASLMSTTNARHDVSTAAGLGNPFEQNRNKLPPGQVFTFHWRDDPRKDQAWYEKQVAEAWSPAVIAQELDIDYSAAVEGVLIPRPWVLSAIGACAKLGIEPSGKRAGALDVADEGMDRNAFLYAHGVEVQYAEEWSGKGDDIFGTTQRTFDLCDDLGASEFRFDSDGLGAGVRGDARVINERRGAQRLPIIEVQAFRGSAAPFEPERMDEPGRQNKDFFANSKAQSWWALRRRFRNVYLWVTEGKPANVDDIISISEECPLKMELAAQLSQPTYSVNGAGKLLVDKKPEGARSPNLADALMIRFARAAAPLVVTGDVLARAALPLGVQRMLVPPPNVPPVGTGRSELGGGGLEISQAILDRARGLRRR